jgi:regulator of sigma E protease
MDIVGSVWHAASFLLGYLLPFLFVLTIVVFVHELGHFLVGRWCGVDVKTFSIGFGRELFGFYDRHGTRWRFALIPLGGYVKFSGDADATSSTTSDSLSGMSREERERSFPAQSIGERAAIVAAGPIANFLLAILIFGATAYFVGKPILAPRVDSVTVGGAAARAGLQSGDLVRLVDGREVKSFSDLQRAISIRPGETFPVTIDRNGSTVVVSVTPDLVETSSPLGKQRLGIIGVQASAKPEDWSTQHFSLGESVRLGMSETWFVVERTYDYIAKLIKGKESTDQLSGPIRIAQVSGIVASSGGSWR